MIPARKEEVTAKWLQTVLADSGAGLTSLSVSDGSSNRGFTGQILRLDLEFNGVEQPLRSLILKIPLDLAVESEHKVAMFAANQNEISWYTDLSDGCPVRIPKCYYADVDPDRYRTCLLLEDLRSWEATAPGNGLNQSQAELAVTSLARLHGHYWNRGAEELNSPSPDQETASLIDSISSGWDDLMDWMGDQFDADFANKKEACIDAMGAFPQQLAASTRTLIHGDYKIDNLLFSDDPLDRDKIALLDWQGVAIGSGAEELAGFLPRSLSLENRRIWETRLLKIYHEALVSSGISSYTLQDMTHDYHLGLLISFVSNIGFTPTLFSGALSAGDPERDKRMREYFELIVRRKYAAVADNNVLALL